MIYENDIFSISFIRKLVLKYYSESEVNNLDRRNFMVNLILGILAFFFGYTIKKEGENVKLLKTDAGMVHPAQYGAKGNGTTDDTAAIKSANAVQGNVLISDGNFRITKNTHLGHVFFLNGGTITIDSGIVLTIDAVHADPATVLFKGAGAVVTSDNRYSVGWFEGNYFNNKWDFCRKAWRTEANNGVGTRKYVYVPNPKADDPACGPSLDAQYAWKINAPVQFEFEDDCLIFDSEAIFNVVSATQGFVFSPYNASASNNNKTDEIRFPKGLVVEGGLNGTTVATDGIVISGGARITFNGETRVKSFTNSCVNINSANAPTEEIIFDFLEVTGFGRVGLIVDGKRPTSTSRVGSSNLIRYLFTNGGNSGCKNVVQINGCTSNIKIENYYENAAIQRGLYDVSDSQILIQSTRDGESQHITLRNLHSAISTKSIVKTANKGGRSKLANLTIDKFYAASANIWLDLAYLTNATITNGAISCPPNGIVISSDCDHININATDPNVISGSCPQLYFNNAYYGNIVGLANNSVGSVKLNSGVNGFFDIVCKNDSNCSATFLIRNGGAVVPIYTGSNATLQSGTKPTGTTGSTGKVNIFFIKNTVYVENQVGGSRDFVIHGLSY
jgi:hypothetical protein